MMKCNITDNVDGICTDYLAMWRNAIDQDNIFLVKKMLDDGYDINTKFGNNVNALILSSKIGADKVFNELIVRPDLDVNAATFDGDSALHWTVFKSNELYVSKLLERPDININIQNEDGATPLHLAIEGYTTTHYDEIVWMLMKHPNIDLKILSNGGNMPVNNFRSKQLKELHIQQLILDADETLFNWLYNRTELHPTIKQQYPELMSAVELNIL